MRAARSACGNEYAASHRAQHDVSMVSDMLLTALLNILAAAAQVLLPPLHLVLRLAPLPPLLYGRRALNMAMACLYRALDSTATASLRM